MSPERLTLIASIATLITAGATLATVWEIRRQRRSTYKPDLIFRPAHFNLFQGPSTGFTSLYLSLDQKPGGGEVGRERELTAALYNAGAGAAKYIGIQWQFDIAGFSGTVAELLTSTDVKVEYDMRSSLEISFEQPDSGAMTHYIDRQSTTTVSVIPAAASEVVALPDGYVSLLTAYFFGIAEQPPGEGSKSLADPSPIRALLSYSDLEGDTHRKTFIFTPHPYVIYKSRTTQHPHSTFRGAGLFEVREA